MQDLGEGMAQGLASARQLFYEDLWLGMPGVPVYRVAKLVDNWDARKLEASFITDSRNEDELAGSAESLLESPPPPPPPPPPGLRVRRLMTSFRNIVLPSPCSPTPFDKRVALRL
jgi:hypothetical protein